MSKHIAPASLLLCLSLAFGCGGGSDASPRAVCQKMASLTSESDFDLDDCAGDLARLKEGNAKLYACMSKCAMSASTEAAASTCVTGCDSPADDSDDDTEVAADTTESEPLEPLTPDECMTIVTRMAGMDGIEEFWPPHSVKDDILKELENCAKGHNDPYTIKGYRCTMEKAERHHSYALALDRCW